MSQEHIDREWGNEAVSFGENEGLETKTATTEENSIVSVDPVERSTSAPPVLQESLFAGPALLDPAGPGFVLLFCPSSILKRKSPIISTKKSTITIYIHL
jgi:hypothetical protein